MEQLRTEVHEIQKKIFELQEKSERLSNGQRYAAINQIEKNINPLRTDLKLLERAMDEQEDFDKKIEERFNIVLDQINALEDLKSDLNAKIRTENEHTRRDMNKNLLRYMTEELTPLKNSVEEARKETRALDKELKAFKDEYNTIQLEKEVEEAKKFDKIKFILTGVIALIAAITAVITLLQPALKIIKIILFG